jgi:L-rhamnose isomerase
MTATPTAYALAREQYAALGVDTEAALKTMAGLPVSLHCWQGDDVAGFERSGCLDGGIAATGNYPGKARTPEELRADLDLVLKLVPGANRVNLHAIYAETGGKRVDRDALGPEHFDKWIAWAKAHQIGMDFNPSFFAHPLAASGLTLSHPDAKTRAFWVRHGQACRRIGAAMGQALGSPAVTNVWIPDGSKDTPFDRQGPRERLVEALDEVFAEPIDARHNLDAVECKLFGIGVESYTVGSHEFYLGYAAAHRKLLCLDAGHFHPTETLADKISSTLLWVPGLLLHVSRGVRWDSDHVVALTDDLYALCQELVRGGHLGRVHIGLDYFDASINRIAAWTIGARNAKKALLAALLEPAAQLRAAEQAGDFTARLAGLEEAKLLPVGAVWGEFCQRAQTPIDGAWLADVQRYERDVLSKRK